MIVRHGETASRIEGADLTRFMATLNEYLGFVEKVDKRIRNEKLTELLARAELIHRADFASKAESEVPAKLAALHAELTELADEFQFKVAESGRGRGAPHLVGLLYRCAGRHALHRLDPRLQPRVPPDDVEVLAHQGIPGAAIPDRIRRQRRSRPPTRRRRGDSEGAGTSAEAAG